MLQKEKVAKTDDPSKTRLNKTHFYISFSNTSNVLVISKEGRPYSMDYSMYTFRRWHYL